MKIIGVTYYRGEPELVQKSDSALLVNRKPLFVPEHISVPAVLPCLAFRVCRLGRSISPRFALRYADAVAAGADFFGSAELEQAIERGHSWLSASNFEGSFAIGGWNSLGEEMTFVWRHEKAEGEGATCFEQTLHTEEVLQELIPRISELMTIRQGDILYTSFATTPFLPKLNDCITAYLSEAEQEPVFYCKIK